MEQMPQSYHTRESTGADLLHADTLPCVFNTLLTFKCRKHVYSVQETNYLPVMHCSQPSVCCVFLTITAARQAEHWHSRSTAFLWSSIFNVISHAQHKRSMALVVHVQFVTGSAHTDSCTYVSGKQQLSLPCTVIAACDGSGLFAVRRQNACRHPCAPVTILFAAATWPPN